MEDESPMDVHDGSPTTPVLGTSESTSINDDDDDDDDDDDYYISDIEFDEPGDEVLDDLPVEELLELVWESELMGKRLSMIQSQTVPEDLPKFTKEEIACIDIVRLMDNAGCPRYLYNQLLKKIQRAHNRQSF